MKNKKPNLTYSIVIICLAIFTAEIFLDFFDGVSDFFKEYGFSWENLQKGNYWVFVTSLFIHGSTEHLVLNMIALIIFGRIIELELGWKKFLLVFFVSAFVGELGILASSFLGLSSPSIPTIGASAAVFGLMGTAMLIKPFEFIMYPYLIPIPLIIVAVFYTLYNIAALIVVITTDMSSSVSYISHIAGLASGMFFGFREERSKKGLIAILILLALLILVPFLWILFAELESFSYVNIITELFK